MLTIEDYETLPKDYARFVVSKDHISPEIEKVKKIVTDVEKYALS